MDDLIEIIRTYNNIDFLGSNFFKEFQENLEISDKIDCYFDCDGVLFDTIKVSFEELGLNHKIENKDQKIQDMLTEYYKNVDWIDLINRSGEINDSLLKLNIIKTLNLFKNVAVATHRHSYLNEALSKKQVLNERVKGMTVFDIPFKIPKEVALNSIGNILVDDSRKKIVSWVNSGGIGVLFDQDINELILPTNETPYFITNDLLDVLKIIYLKYYLKKEKTLVKK